MNSSPASEASARIYFTDCFNVEPKLLADYGAFNVACLLDLPLFIDPFLLFTSKKAEYQALHEQIIKYLRFLRDRASTGNLSPGLLRAWYCFPEVKQNKLGFCMTGNAGRGLGLKFAQALNENLHSLFHDFGKEQVTKGSHLEKLVLIREGVGRDCISDFTTNLIKGYLLEYTQAFAVKHIDRRLLRTVKIHRVAFNYDIEYWEDSTFELPWLEGDYIILTPVDILTKDDIWINKEDLRRDFPGIRESIPNDALRAQIDHYFKSILPKEPTEKDEKRAMEQTLRRFPELIDFFIRKKEDTGDQAVRQSAERVKSVENQFIQSILHLARLLLKTGEFYLLPGGTLDETGKKIAYLKQVIENQDGYRIFYVDGKRIERERDLQILFKLVWEGSASSVDSEVNNGRGPVDFKVSRGSGDSTLVEFKLAGNSQLRRNLENQVEIYKKANNTKQSFKVILYFTQYEELLLKGILKEIDGSEAQGIVLIDARSDNKPSASRA